MADKSDIFESNADPDATRPTIVSGEGQQLSALRAAVAASRKRQITRMSLRRRARQWFAADRLRDMGTTLALVVPLTVLIWVWAEREEQVQDVHRTFYVDLRPSDPAKTLTFDTSAIASTSLSPGHDGVMRLQIDANLQGPRSSIDTLFESLNKDPSKSNLTLDVQDTTDVGQSMDVQIQPLIDQQKLMSDLGVSVRATDPGKARVIVDRVAERDLPITLPPELNGVVQATNVEPSTVHVRGPERVMTQLETSGALVAQLDLKNEAIANVRPNVPQPFEAVKLRALNLPGLSVQAPASVKVTLSRSADASGVINAMTVYVSKPATMTGTIRVDPPTLTRVRIIGRPDVVRRLVEGRGDQPPYAELTLTVDDIGKTGRRTPTFPNLPEGVQVDKNQVLDIAFDATDRGGGSGNAAGTGGPGGTGP